MQIARILYPVKVLGPGNRIGIWVHGCKRACPGCANPELWEPDARKNISIEQIRKMVLSVVEKYPVDGITISGGEPFLQTKELAELVSMLREYTEDILIFTGYERRVLLARKKDKDATRYVLNSVAVLVDGKYVEEKNDGHPLRGSANQKLYYRDENIRTKYESYIEEQKKEQYAQLFPASDGTIMVGIHRKEFRREMDEKMQGRGVRKEG